MDLIKAKDIKNTLDIINKYESWRQSQDFENTIRELNSRDIDYIRWPNIEIYKFLSK
jgi:hypothetical protein